MIIPAISPSSTRSGAAPAAGDAASVDFQSFLRLLTAQLRYQDPLSPLDSTQFVSQLANFSTVEQLVTANRQLSQIAGDGGGIDDYADWLGRAAEITGAPTRFDGAPVDFRLAPAAEAERVELVVRDSAGLEIDRQRVENSGAIQRWNGAGANGRGPYIFAADYVGRDGAVRTGPVSTFEIITEVRATAAGPQLTLANGASIAPAAVLGLSARAPSP